MKYIILLILFFWVLSSQAQDSTVCIKPSTARYYLEIDDEVRLRRKKDSLNTQIITNLESEITFKDKIISSYQQDSILHKEQVELNQSLVLLYKEDSKKQQRNARLTRIGAGLTILLILILK